MINKRNLVTEKAILQAMVGSDTIRSGGDGRGYQISIDKLC